MMQDERPIDTPEASAKRREDRRAFITAAVGAVAIGAGAFVFADPVAAQTVTDVDVLNYLLNIEYLQANFYGWAVNGAGLASADTSGPTGTTPGAVSGGSKVTFTDPIVAAYAAEIANAQLLHVRFLRTSLSATSAVAQPAIDLGNSATSAFSVLAQSAGIVAPGAAFDPFASDTNFLLAAFMIKDVSVTAYNAAVSLIASKTYLESVAGLLATESYHAAIIRTTLYSKGIANPGLITAAQGISDARDALDGGSDDDQGITPANSNAGTVANIAPVDGNGLVFSRATGQALNVFYLNRTAVKTGGFFPAGFNGNITTSAAS